MFVADTKPASPSAARSQSPDPANPWKQIVEPVEPFLDAVSQGLAAQVVAFDPALTQYAEYALTGNGKHLRPALVALSANAVGQSGQDHVTVAVIIEMVHLATLVHDDVMDEAEIRRGRLTLASNWGNDIAVLFGDCLFAHALRLAASFPTPEVCRAVASATNTVCSGEILQNRNRSNFQLTKAEYFRIMEMKTGELFALSCDLAALLAGAPAVQRTSMRQFGMAFGTAYQIFDDCLDLFGTEAQAGKSLGTDLVKGKMTLPMLVLRDRASATDRAELEQLLARWEPGSFSKVVGWLRQYETLKPSRETIHQYLDTARRCAAQVPESAGQRALLKLTDYLEQQVAELGAGLQLGE
jgi:octaprenyl-diphosphate synthase